MIEQFTITATGFLPSNPYEVSNMGNIPLTSILEDISRSDDSPPAIRDSVLRELYKVVPEFALEDALELGVIIDPPPADQPPARQVQAVIDAVQHEFETWADPPAFPHAQPPMSQKPPSDSEASVDNASAVSSRDATLLEDLPPEKLLKTDDHRLIRAGVTCMDSRETVQAYLGYENQHKNRTWVQRLLADRARELADSTGD